MTRLIWLAGSAAMAAIALLIVFRGDAIAADASAGCTPADGFVPAFCVNVPTTTVRRETTVPMTSLPSERADVRAEAAIPAADVATLVASVDRSVERVESAFGRDFSARPRVLLFATNGSFATGAAELFGYSPATARSVATTYGGIFDRPTLTIAMNWSAADRGRVGAAIEHELTHLMVRELTGGSDIPAWVDEGLATLVEQEAGGHGMSADERLVGLALAASGAISLDDIDTVAEWHIAYARIGRPLYAYAANAVSAMESRIGREGTFALLGAVRSGQRFDAAYRAASGESVAELERRVEASASPRIVLGEAGDASGNRAFTVFAGVAGAELKVSITGGRDYSVSFTVRTDGLGMYRGSFGATAAAGEYTVRAAGAEATFSAGR